MNRISNKWTKETAGGCMNFGSWIKNEQYTIQSDKKVTVQILLQQMTEKPTDSFCYIFKGNSNGTKVYHGDRVDEKEKISFKALNQRVSKFTLEANTPYSLMPCTFNPDQIGDYNLIVIWKKDNNVNLTLKPCRSLETISIDSQWSNLTAGGCLNNQVSWLKNPKFSLTIHNDSNLQVMLIQRGLKDSFPIGFHILKGDPKNSIDIIKQTNSYNYAKVIVEDFKIPKGEYILVPSTFNPNEKCDFTIQVSSFKKGEFSLKNFK